MKKIKNSEVVSIRYKKHIDIESKELHLHFKPGEIAYYPDGKEDNTHLSVKGATEIAKIAVIQLQQMDIPLSKKTHQIMY